MLSPHITVSIDQQTLTFSSEGTHRVYSVSTAKNGAGQKMGSGCTPLGNHYIRAKIGAGQAINAVFVGRRPTGEIYSDSLAIAFPNRDWILSRIMWLQGCEPGVNRFGNVDSMRRFIYIHGTPDSEPMGLPLSHGCIRMRNADIVDLFELAEIGTSISINF